MPMYYPDLESVKRCAEAMTKNKGDKQYKGIIPKTEEELPEARIQLGKYFREVWGDIVNAVEVESAATPENYESIMQRYLMLEMAKGKR